MLNVTGINDSEIHYAHYNSVPWEGYIWFTLLTTGNVCGIIGNALVIYCSMEYGSFKMDGATIAFVRQIAISDILFILIYSVPIAVTHLFHRWVLGSWVCLILGHGVTVPVMASINFILAVSLHRYLRCKYPHSVREITATKATQISIAIWLFSLALAIYNIASGKSVEFNGKLAACTFHFGHSAYNVGVMILLTLFPFIAITVINLILWVYVTNLLKQHSGSPTGRSNVALLTTAAVTGLFWISWSATVVRFHYSAIVDEHDVSVGMEKARYLYMLGAYGNPLIYTMVNRGFRDFIRHLLKRIYTKYMPFVKAKKNTVNIGQQNLPSSSHSSHTK